MLVKGSSWKQNWRCKQDANTRKKTENRNDDWYQHKLEHEGNHQHQTGTVSRSGTDRMIEEKIGAPVDMSLVLL